jgi:hypothetical protein
MDVSSFRATVVCALVVLLSYVDDGLADGDDAVDNGHEAGGDRVDHGVELGHVSEMLVLVARDRCNIRKMRRRPLLRLWVVVWFGWLVLLDLVGWKWAESCGLLWSDVGGGWREEKEGQKQQEGSIKRFSSLLHQGMQPRVTR